MRAGLLADTASPAIDHRDEHTAAIESQVTRHEHWADLFFPISLLHVGHWENYLLGYQIRFTLFLVFASGLVAVALRTRRKSV